MCSLLSLFIMSSGHMFHFITTYYVIWSWVPFYHHLLCHLVICSFFSPLMTSGHVFPLSLLIMSSSHVFPFVITYYVIWSCVPFLSPLIMSSGHVFPFVPTYYVLWSYVSFCHHLCQVAIYHVTSCKHLSLLLCQVAICYATFKFYEVMWPYATVCYAALVTFIMSFGHILCYLSSSLFIYN